MDAIPLRIWFLASMTAISWGCGGGDGPSFEPQDGACGTFEVPEPLDPVADVCFDGGDATCPPDPPVEGRSCQGDLECEYEDWGELVCRNGRWEDLYSDGPPPLAEMCLDPFDGEVEGSDVILGPPAGEFRPFTDCERVELTWGPQGGAMVPFRIRVDAGEPPDCVAIRTRMSVGEAAFDASEARAALHCGQSMLVYAVVPWDLQHALCPAADEVVLRLDADVLGIGTGVARVTIETPRDCADQPDEP